MQVTSIRKIESAVSHRICSGQVILNLANAVKELVENSLDAGATNIEIRLKEYGSELIEVADNGWGVSPENFQALTMKYYTSKLSEFSDLDSLMSFGFRGEALSSLCALSDVSVTTRTANDNTATKLVFDKHGKIQNQSTAARAVGTTVSVSKLFSPLPVRFKELQKSVKREFGKLVSLLQSYAIISTGVRILCSNLTGKSGRTIVIQTQGSNSLRDNLVTVFGSKTLACLQPVDASLYDGCGVTGFISKPGSGCGRASGDRQFFYVNKRPVDFSKAGKLVNEIYKSFNSLQFPMAVLNFCLPTNSYDINLTPDKRKILVHSEADLLDAFRGVLNEVFSPSQLNYSVNILDSQSGKRQSNFNEVTMEGSNEEKDKLESEKSMGDHCSQGPSFTAVPASQQTVDSGFLSERDDRLDEGEEAEGDNCGEMGGEESPANNGEEHERCCEGSADILESSQREVDFGSFSLGKKQQNLTGKENGGAVASGKRRLNPEREKAQRSMLAFVSKGEKEAVSIAADSEAEKGRDGKEEDSELEGEEDFEVERENEEGIEPHSDEERTAFQSRLDSDGLVDGNRPHSTAATEELTVVFDIERAKKRVKRTLEKEAEQSSKPTYCYASVEVDGNDKEESLAMATRELEIRFKKEDFRNMEVIGQFNLGFIVAKLGRDLFIIDQHASDEKYNFERLVRSTVLNRQPLIRPVPMELTPSEELVIMSHKDTFRKNGFDFTEDLNAMAGQRLKLTSVPYSKNVTFGVQDVHELVSLLADEPCREPMRDSERDLTGEQSEVSAKDSAAPMLSQGGGFHGPLVRPSRVRSMLASRACRSSIMIGSALSKTEMQRVLSHLSSLDSPWNCPHGRPTMRHLVNLSAVNK